MAHFRRPKLSARSAAREGDILATSAQGVDGEMTARKRRRRALLQDGGPRTPGTQFDTTIMQQTSDATAPCTQSIECDPSWADVASGVVSVYAINTRIRALGLCTGEAASPAGKNPGTTMHKNKKIAAV